MLLKRLAKLIDYDTNEHTLVEIIDELNRKLKNSYILVNNVLEKVAFNDTHLLLQGRKISYEDEKTYVEVFMPPSGLYYNKDSLHFIQRTPQRQWIKSFSPGNNYTVSKLAGRPIVLYEDLFKEYNKTTVIFKDIVYLKWIAVGTFYRNTIHLFNDTFKKEIESLWPQYPSTLDVPNLKEQEEKLILPF